MLSPSLEHVAWRNCIQIYKGTLKFQLVKKFWKQMERSFSSNLHAVASRVIQPLKHYCFCISLKNGVRIISISAFVLGIGFILLGSEITNDSAINQTIGIGCQTTGFIFLFWFLALLLLQTLPIKFPMKCSVFIGYIMCVWLMLIIAAFIPLLFLRGKQDEFSVQIIFAVFVSALGVLFTAYSVFILKSYFCSLENSPELSPRMQSEDAGQEFPYKHSEVLRVHRASISLESTGPSSSRTDWSSKGFPTAVTQSNESIVKEAMKEAKSDKSWIHRSKTFISPFQSLFLMKKEPLSSSYEKRVEEIESNNKLSVTCVSRSQQTSPTPSNQTLKLKDLPLSRTKRYETV